MTVTRLFLIRHGQTDCNLNNRYSGFLDVGLNKTGQLQARRLAAAICQERIDRIYVSDRKRAIQTARIIFKNKKMERLSGLKEVNFGIFEGLTYKEILKKHPLVYKKWLKDPFSVKIPGGEHLLVFKKRVIRSLKTIIKSNKGKSVAVVTHGGVISIYLNHLLKSRKFWETVTGSASITTVEHDGRKTQIKSVNDTEHLKCLKSRLS